MNKIRVLKSHCVKQEKRQTQLVCKKTWMITGFVDFNQIYIILLRFTVVFAIAQFIVHDTNPQENQSVSKTTHPLESAS